MRPLAAVLLALAAIAGAGRAAADVPPDPSSIEAHCTATEQCPSGITCSRTVNAPEDAARKTEACEQEARTKGLTRRCGYGATRHTDLYCPAGEKGTWSPPGSGSKCSVGAPGDGEAPAPTLLIAGLVAAVLGRRRARPV